MNPKRERQALALAIGAQDNELALELASQGADLEVWSDVELTPLMLAVASGNHEGARILLEAGAKPNVRRKQRLPTGSAIFYCSTRSSPGPEPPRPSPWLSA
ncbi:MAG: ankyrin repeat domain-containing protein [Myxococcota bacterium]